MPGGSEYGLLSATAQLYGRAETLFTLPPEAFSAAAEGAFRGGAVRYGAALGDLAVPEKDFIDFLKLSFGQKRKTLWNNLKLAYDAEPLRAALSKAGIKATVRAETLPLEKSAALFQALRNGRESL